MLGVVLIGVGLALAYANGANDNFKGVATLFGSGTTDYRRALGWATGTTFLGSIASIYVASKIVTIFSGAGLVASSLSGEAAFLPAVAFASATTVLAATWLGFPISTTHSLLGALIGPALVAGATAIDPTFLVYKFALPLLSSPIIAIVLSFALYTVFRRLRESFGVEKEMCVCVGETEGCNGVSESGDTLVLTRQTSVGAAVLMPEECEERYVGRVFGLNVQEALDRCHYASAGLVCFARGLNDTPKIAAVLLAASVFGATGCGLWVALGMAAGGLLAARKVGHLMAEGITPMNHGQGFTANLVTGLLVVVASRFGLPVSTTHVSCGAIFGIGMRTGKGNFATMGMIVLAWVATLPAAAGLGALYYSLFSVVLA